MSAYFCAICKHFTSEDKNPYHCKKCGICRLVTFSYSGNIVTTIYCSCRTHFLNGHKHGCQTFKTMVSLLFVVLRYWLACKGENRAVEYSFLSLLAYSQKALCWYRRKNDCKVISIVLVRAVKRNRRSGRDWVC